MSNSAKHLTRFVVDFALSKALSKREIEPVKLMETYLENIYPDIFTTKGEPNKLLDLAIIIYDSYLNGEHLSEDELAEKLRWKSRGAVSNYLRILKEIGFIDNNTRKFNPNFLYKLYGELVIKLHSFNELLESIKRMVPKPSPIGEGPFMFSNTGELIMALIELFNKVVEGEEVYLFLKEGRTWGSKGIGDLMRGMLANLVAEKHVKLRVLTTSFMEKELFNFFSSIGEVVIDEQMAKQDRRLLYIGGYIVEVLKIPGITAYPTNVVGVIRADVYDEKNKIAKERFERLRSQENVKSH